jgi:hypothetical protein
VSFSELSAYRHCALKHQLGYIERWRTEETSEALSRGKLFHSVMENHYRAIQAKQQGWDEAIEGYGRALRELLYDSHTGQQTEEQALVEWMYRGHSDHWSDDARRWRILGVEHKLEDWLPTRKGTRSYIRMKGTIDLIVRDHEMGGMWIVDHKTCANLPKGRETDLDDQFAIYQWLLTQQGHDIRGIIYNAVRTKKLKTRDMEPDERFKRIPTIRTVEEIREVAIEAYEHMRKAWSEGTDQKPVPRSPDGDLCRWKCNVTEACLMGRKGGDMRKYLSDIGFVQDFERH